MKNSGKDNLAAYKLFWNKVKYLILKLLSNLQYVLFSLFLPNKNES